MNFATRNPFKATYAKRNWSLGRFVSWIMPVARTCAMYGFAWIVILMVQDAAVWNFASWGNASRKLTMGKFVSKTAYVNLHYAVIWPVHNALPWTLKQDAQVANSARPYRFRDISADQNEQEEVVARKMFIAKVANVTLDSALTAIGTATDVAVLSSVTWVNAKAN